LATPGELAISRQSAENPPQQPQYRLLKTLYGEAPGKWETAIIKEPRHSVNGSSYKDFGISRPPPEPGEQEFADNGKSAGTHRVNWGNSANKGAVDSV